MHDGNGTFYIASVEGTPCGTLHLLIDGGTAGIYAVSTLRSHRRRGVASALLRRAVADALERRCDVIGLRTVSGGDALRLYASLGFVVSYESAMWVSA
jgi:GNAT superfamily N-acetyltransferase